MKRTTESRLWRDRQRTTGLIYQCTNCQPEREFFDHAKNHINDEERFFELLRLGYNFNDGLRDSKFQRGRPERFLGGDAVLLEWLMEYLGLEDQHWYTCKELGTQHKFSCYERLNDYE